MTLPEVETWFRDIEADSVTKARMEALLNKDPQRRSRTISKFNAMERDSVAILERDDAAALLLSPEEIDAWLPTLRERCEGVVDRFPILKGDEEPNEAESQVIGDTLFPLLGEMAEHVFTPERIGSLISQLREYRYERFGAGEKGIAGLAFAAIKSLEREDEPSKNHFLLTICLNSIRRIVALGAEPGTGQHG